MPATIIRKTHPMVLIAAVALTVFSLLGSAAITGLIPLAHSEKQDMVQSLTDNSRVAVNDAPRATSQQAQPNLANVCKECGTVVSIRTVKQDGDASGIGAVAGGVAGGVLGNQIGKGNGNTLMTVLGVGGGAYAGHTIEKKVKATTAYVIRVRMQNGGYRTVTQYSPPKMAIGDHVKLKGGELVSA